MFRSLMGSRRFAPAVGGVCALAAFASRLVVDSEPLWGGGSSGTGRTFGSGSFFHTTEALPGQGRPDFPIPEPRINPDAHSIANST